MGCLARTFYDSVRARRCRGGPECQHASPNRPSKKSASAARSLSSLVSYVAALGSILFLVIEIHGSRGSNPSIVEVIGIHGSRGLQHIQANFFMIFFSQIGGLDRLGSALLVLLVRANKRHPRKEGEGQKKKKGAASRQGICEGKRKKGRKKW